MSLPGSMIHPAATPLTQQERQQFVDVVTPHLSDNMNRNVGIHGLQRFNKTGKLIGTALTVKVRGGDNLLVYKAMTMLQDGHVLVIDAQGDENNAIIGELIKLDCIRRGCVGFVIDGAIRDVASFENTPCYARSITHRGYLKQAQVKLMYLLLSVVKLLIPVTSSSAMKMVWCLSLCT
jgi:regulator of RNase E activity RraA